ncbi:hypothetical protein M9H77_11939 [Catharanthus roseus]|uniref:Uncharacterized protein n=1 Tax=Catharanthus roseus TaxID=4058 RepID=A0ACC0BG09_CATRO|nr:hypothetical protein M9H77_11939 [Catharanthus roseus]
MSRTSKGRAVTDWMQPKIPVEVSIFFLSFPCFLFFFSLMPFLDYSIRAAIIQCIGVVLHIGVAFSKQFIIAVKQDFAVYNVRGFHCTWLVPPYEGLFRWHGRFRQERGVAQSVYVDTASCSAVGRPPF